MGSSKPLRVVWSGTSGWPTAPQQDRIALLQQVDRARGHHFAPAEVMLGPPIEILKHQRDVVLFHGRFEYALRFGYDFGSNAVAGNHCNGKSFHALEDNSRTRA